MKGNVADVSERKFRLLSQHVPIEHLTIVTSLGVWVVIYSLVAPTFRA